ncbi:class I SAM-dependent methyltransferase [Patescibacteria group bacterium]|nr:class I SAM-dependent methyltransferase [Patescibacteria group bacterium]
MDKCKICKTQTKPVISFGKMPIANGFISSLNADEFFYDLKVLFCPNCFMVQLGQIPRPEMMFGETYAYISSTSSAMADHFKQQADEIIRLVSKRKDPFVVELGCNDGIMLKHIAEKGINHLGIEPANNVADLAKKTGVRVLTEFFDQKSAQKIARAHGPADVICASNTLLSIENLNSAFEGFNILLRDNGLLFFEDPYLFDIVSLSSFDQIYDEHIYYFSGHSVRELAKRHGMKLVKMNHQDVHGGSMCYYIKKGTAGRPSAQVAKWLKKEKGLKLDRITGYKRFKRNVDNICRNLKNTLKKIKSGNNQIVGYGATSKSTTLLNYTRIGPKTIDYISDNTPTKIGKFTPGMHIPIKAHSQFTKDSPPFTVLFAWNHKKEIFQKEKDYRKKGGKFITYFPKVTIE